MFLQKYVDEQFLIAGVFITQMYGNVGIQFDELKVKTNCHFMSDVKGRTYYVWHLPGRIYLFYQTAWQ